MTRSGLRALLALGLALAIPSGSYAAETTTFSYESAGCSGGGDECGTFPLVRLGTANYSHMAGNDGRISLNAETTGGAPVSICIPGRSCEPAARYHAEALGRVWTDVTTSAGSPSVDIEADHELEELSADASSLLEDATVASLSGSVSIAPTAAFAGATCSDGSAVIGSASAPIDANSTLGQATLSTTASCAGAGTLPSMQWRVSLTVKVAATSDGGPAEATARARLSRVISNA